MKAPVRQAPMLADLAGVVLGFAAALFIALAWEVASELHAFFSPPH
jgi:hypothetical protein